MTERREIRQRSQAVWDRAKEAYLAGEPAASVARRFDVGYGNLRYRAHAEGWTRKAALARAEVEAAAEAARLAGRGDPPASGGCSGADLPPAENPEPLEPHVIRRRALARADALLAEGRAVEALAQIRAAEALARLGAEQAEFDRMETWEEDTEAVRIKVGRIVEDRAAELAQAMLAEGVKPGVRLGGYALHWRAAMYGPGAAEADRRQAEADGWADRHWDAEGRLRERQPGEFREG